MKKTRIMIVLPPVLPLPSVKGGAVETLMQFLIDENEKKKRLQITALSTWDEKAELLGSQYEYTKFYYIHNHTAVAKLKYQMSRVLRKVTGIRPEILDSYHRDIRKIIEENEQPDICIVEGGSFTKEFSRISRLVNKDKIVIHLHACFDAPPGVDEIFPRAIAISEYVKQQWQKNSDSEVVVLKNCIADVFFESVPQKDIATLRKKYGYSEEDFVLLYCGRMISAKGVKELLTAVQDMPNIKLMLLGGYDEGSAEGRRYKRELERIIEGADNITYIGKAANKELPIYYQCAQAVAIPSMWEEGAGLVVLEAMASGRPMILTDSGGMKEYALKGGYLLAKRTEIVESLKACIKVLANDPLKCRKMAEINKEAAKIYTQEKYYDAFVNVAEKMINNGNGK